MIFAYSGLLLIAVLSEAFRKRDRLVDFLSIFNFFFLLSYVCTPLAFLFSPQEGWKYLSFYPQAADSWFVLAVVGVSLILVNLSYIFFNYYSPRFEIVNIWSFRRFSRFLKIGVLLGCFFIFLKSLGYGGLINFAITGYLNRTGDIDGGIFDYVTPIVKLIVPFVFLQYSFHLEQKSRSGFIVLFIGMFFYLVWVLSTGGRGNLILLLMPILFIYFNESGFNKKNVSLAVMFVILALAIIKYGRSFFFSLALSEGDISNMIDLFVSNQLQYEKRQTSVFVSIFSHFDHSIVSTYHIINDPDLYGGFRYLFDYPRVILDALPKFSMARGNIDAVVSSVPAQINKELFGLSDGYVPVGWVGLAYLNGGFLFLVVAAIAGGCLGGLLSSVVSKAKTTCKSGFYMFFALLWYKMVFHSDPLNLVIPMFSDYVFMLFLLLVFRIRVIRPVRVLPSNKLIEGI